MDHGEAFLRAFHDLRPGITSQAFARGGSYVQFAARVPVGRVLDVACGDGTLLELLGPAAVGVDVSLGELRVAIARTRTSGVVQARAQALPFPAACFDAATCHLAFMLFDDVECVIAELGRVLRPGAPFLALLGGGPTADGRDAFHVFAEHVPRTRLRFGDRRASTETGWRELFAAWRDITFERWPIDLGGTFDEVWTFLASSYQLAAADHDRARDAVRAAFPGERVPCTVACYLARATRRQIGSRSEDSSLRQSP